MFHKNSCIISVLSIMISSLLSPMVLLCTQMSNGHPPDGTLSMLDAAAVQGCMDMPHGAHICFCC